MKKRSLFILLLLIGILSVGVAFSASAASKKAIKSVTIRASYTSAATDDFDDIGEAEIIASGTGYELESYETENPDEVMEGTAKPVVKIYLSARDGYYFGITKASQIKLQKCKYKTAARQNSSTTLVVTVELTDIKLSIGNVEELELADSGKAKWEEIFNAGSYDVRVFRNGSRIASDTVTGTEYDISPYYLKEGSYSLRVRPSHKSDSKIKGEWAESNEVYLTEQQAKDNREAAERAESAGDWISDKGGWKFRLPDGTFVANAWRKINKQWYYFLPDGHMATGWTQIEGSYYYFDPSNGVLWVNTTSPDGYTIGIDGRRVEK